jgi:hypothetical protein
VIPSEVRADVGVVVESENLVDGWRQFVSASHPPPGVSLRVFSQLDENGVRSERVLNEPAPDGVDRSGMCMYLRNDRWGQAGLIEDRSYSR